MIRSPSKLICVIVSVSILASLFASGGVSTDVLARVKAIFPIVVKEGRYMTDEETSIQAKARLELKELGPQADRALVELLKDAEFREKNTTSLFDHLLYDRDLVSDCLPIMRQILKDFLSEPSNEIRGDILRLCEYLSVWGNESDDEILKLCLRKTDNRIIQVCIDQTESFKKLRVDGKPMPWEADPNGRTKFYQFGYTSAEWDALHRKTSAGASKGEQPQSTSTGKPLQVKKQTMSDPANESSQRNWTVWFMVVIVATGGAMWLFFRKSSK